MKRYTISHLLPFYLYGRTELRVRDYIPCLAY